MIVDPSGGDKCIDGEKSYGIGKHPSTTGTCEQLVCARDSDDPKVLWLSQLGYVKYISCIIFTLRPLLNIMKSY